MTNLEKAKSLRMVRKRLGWTQPSMADALGLDATYLSQLENAKREVDEYYVVRADEIEANIEKSKTVKDAVPTGAQTEVRTKCHQYIDRVLDACGGDLDRMTWTYVELQQHFPLEKRPGVLAPYRAPNSILPSEAESSAAFAEKALEGEGRGYSRKHEADGTSGRKSEPSHDVSKGTKNKQSTQGPAQGSHGV